MDIGLEENAGYRLDGCDKNRNNNTKYMKNIKLLKLKKEFIYLNGNRKRKIQK